MHLQVLLSLARVDQHMVLAEFRLEDYDMYLDHSLTTPHLGGHSGVSSLPATITGQQVPPRTPHRTGRGVGWFAARVPGPGTCNAVPFVLGTGAPCHKHHLHHCCCPLVAGAEVAAGGYGGQDHARAAKGCPGALPCHQGRLVWSLLHPGVPGACVRDCECQQFHQCAVAVPSCMQPGARAPCYACLQARWAVRAQPISLCSGTSARGGRLLRLVDVPGHFATSCLSLLCSLLPPPATPALASTLKTPIKWNPQPRGNKPCPGDCNPGIGTCDYDTGRCYCPAGYGGRDCREQRNRECYNMGDDLRDKGWHERQEWVHSRCAGALWFVCLCARACVCVRVTGNTVAKSMGKREEPESGDMLPYRLREGEGALIGCCAFWHCRENFICRAQHWFLGPSLAVMGMPPGSEALKSHPAFHSGSAAYIRFARLQGYAT